MDCLVQDTAWVLAELASLGLIRSALPLKWHILCTTVGEKANWGLTLTNIFFFSAGLGEGLGGAGLGDVDGAGLGEEGVEVGTVSSRLAMFRRLPETQYPYNTGKAAAHELLFPKQTRWRCTGWLHGSSYTDHPCTEYMPITTSCTGTTPPCNAGSDHRLSSALYAYIPCRCCLRCLCSSLQP